MYAYLAQHAEARAEEEDPQRPLSPRGADIRRVGVFLAEQAQVSVTHIQHSGKTRARQTAEALKPPQGMPETDGLAPLDNPSIWASRLGPAEGV